MHYIGEIHNITERRALYNSKYVCFTIYLQFSNETLIQHSHLLYQVLGVQCMQICRQCSNSNSNWKWFIVQSTINKHKSNIQRNNKDVMTSMSCSTYNALSIFCEKNPQSIHNRTPIARPWGRDLGSLLWVQYMTLAQGLFLSSGIKFNSKLNNDVSRVANIWPKTYGWHWPRLECLSSFKNR